MWIKFLPYIAVAALFFLGGLIFQSKVLAPKIVIPSCPTCPACPPQTSLSIAPFDVNKLKNRGSFTYAPQISGSITVVVDSTMFKQLYYGNQKEK